MLLSTLLALLAADATPPGALAPRELTLAHLQQVTQQARAFFPKDQFDGQRSMNSVVGRPLSFVITPLERGPANTTAVASPLWPTRLRATDMRSH
jgi:hypothetical protein